MKATLVTAVAAALSLSGLASADICNNNCGRQVAGVNNPELPVRARRATCSSFLDTTTTVTPPASTVITYNRDVTATPAVTGTVPTWANMCSDVAEYWSACQCFDMSPTTVTVIATAPMTTTTPAATTCTCL
ncbi:hypothetical protein JDV02_002542 [Purpureocillium takamizusanense]|uniref:Uncharacterized protein n=1 Tax=Purpureocillium takamizusanense TaxID=2060973 RepID=A0A9Q8V8R7_9HYPO|nr:uncharacterized protein JDV02_002542 [Purpureocillium takamizusanense]UNI16067.1 hypothetical protein JDV02_002542 [Purpureocillium takamizusanense]